MSVVLAATAVAGAVSAGTGTTTDAEVQLARRFAPYVRIQQQDEQCGPGEAFQPADVAIILDQSDVVLRDSSGRVILESPSAQDLFEAPEGSNFDLPGSSLRPGCDFDRRFGWRSSGAQPKMYARIVTDPADPQRLVVQYWMYFVYNDWNNRHESDWEMAQLVFDAATPEEALVEGPSMMTLSQHWGNERRPWSEVTRIGDRPVVYPAEGAHAIFYSSNLWFGKSGDAGFGCDDTRGPSMQLDPAVEVLPDEITADGGFGWLGFQGRWGERQRSVNDSELGPQYTRQWSQPLAYMASGRDGSVAVPQVELGVTRFFCAATVRVSAFINQMLDRPAVLLGTLLGLAALVVIPIRRTRWSPASPVPLAAQRRNGQILVSALRLVSTNKRRFLPVSLLAIVGGVLGALLQIAVVRYTFIGDFAGLTDRQGFAAVTAALAAGAMETIPVMILTLVVGVAVAHGTESAPTPGSLGRAVRGRGVLPMIVVFATLLFTGPLSLLLVPRWIAAPSVGVVEDARLMPSLARSNRLSRRNRLRILALIVVGFGGALLLGPLIGVIVLLVTSRGFAFVNVVAGLVNAVTLPWLAAVLALMYGDLRARSESDARSA